MKNDRFDAFNREVKATVGAIAAWPSRKRAMEEELCAHYASAYAEELQLSGDEKAAAEAAKKRLGSLSALTMELAVAFPGGNA